MAHLQNDLVDIAGGRFGRFGVGGGVASSAQREAWCGEPWLPTSAGFAGPLAAISIWGRTTSARLVVDFWDGLGDVHGIVGTGAMERLAVARLFGSGTRCGVPERLVVPRRDRRAVFRIQHSEIQQGPMGRWLGHCTLKL